MFQLHCPLGHALEISTEHIGQRLMCPVCQAVVHASPPRPGETPGAKYEVLCAQGHILRVKRKYLGKEVRCPSCQQLVSMKPGMLLTSSGLTLAVAVPEQFKKLTTPKSSASNGKPPTQPKSAPQAPARKDQHKERMAEATMRASRIPPPPQVGLPPGTDDEFPKQPEVLEDHEEHFSVDTPAPSKSSSITPVTVPDDDFEFEVVDTQFNMELKETGLATLPRGAVKKSAAGNSMAPPVQRKPAPSTSSSAPTGLQSLSGSEMMKVNNAALDVVAVQAPQAMMQFNCPNGHFLEVEAQHRGKQIQCPLCKVIFAMPTG